MNPLSNVSSSPLQAYAQQLQKAGTAQPSSQTKPAQKLEIQETGLDEQRESRSGQQEIGEGQPGSSINLLA
jgi:hypothetical protein